MASAEGPLHSGGSSASAPRRGMRPGFTVAASCPGLATLTPGNTFTTIASDWRPRPRALPWRNCWWAAAESGRGNLPRLPSASTMPRSLTKISIAECGVGSSSSICGTRLQNIQLEPAACEMISYSCRVSRPICAPSAIASAAAAMWTPARSWLTILMLLPAPGPPSMRKSLPGGAAVRAPSTAEALARPPPVPEAMMVRAPSAARATPPETGASTNSSPRALSAVSRSAIALEVLGGTVELSTTTLPCGKESAAPCRKRMSSACSPLTTMSTRAVTPSAAPATEPAGRPPPATNRSTAGCQTSYPFTRNPALTSEAAMPDPIAPRPMKPTEAAMS
mmetsp:Transcript_13074/g.30993  ORF Transcript_13074/g.30993 Transcript_13074/m.30993 type:complete len:336 (+) Transcript_13074:2240-3247(+)